MYLSAAVCFPSLPIFRCVVELLPWFLMASKFNLLSSQQPSAMISHYTPAQTDEVVGPFFIPTFFVNFQKALSTFCNKDRIIFFSLIHKISLGKERHLFFFKALVLLCCNMFKIFSWFRCMSFQIFLISFVYVSFYFFDMNIFSHDF